ncbi:hypothetical protein B0H11DRAFT_1914839 [Mycena galericulata]|nr:hypothetical protein B0H11DRAFT_1914839 [Mycena galericulata]
MDASPMPVREMRKETAVSGLEEGCRQFTCRLDSWSGAAVPAHVNALGMLWNPNSDGLELVPARSQAKTRVVIHALHVVVGLRLFARGERGGRRMITVAYFLSYPCDATPALRNSVATVTNPSQNREDPPGSSSASLILSCVQIQSSSSQSRLLRTSEEPDSNPCDTCRKNNCESNPPVEHRLRYDLPPLRIASAPSELIRHELNCQVHTHTFAAFLKIRATSPDSKSGTGDTSPQSWSSPRVQVTEA